MLHISIRHFNNHHMKRSASHFEHASDTCREQGALNYLSRLEISPPAWRKFRYAHLFGSLTGRARSIIIFTSMLWSIANRSIRSSHKAAFVNWEHIHGCPPANDSAVKYISVERGVCVLETLPAFSFSSDSTKRRFSDNVHTHPRKFAALKVIGSQIKKKRSL